MSPPLPSPPPKPPISKSRGAKRRGRPRKLKKDRCVFVTLTLPNAAYRKHLLRLSKESGHKTLSAFIISRFPPNNPPLPPTPTLPPLP